jgi:UDP-N-acetyl-D-glucosamine dehydrogenase
MKAVVVGLGKVGLPIAARIALAGHEVVGCDIDERVVASVNDGRAPFPNETGLDEALAATRDRLTAVTNTTAAVSAGAELVIAVPPLLVDDRAQPDWTALDAVVVAIGAGLDSSSTTVVAIETTVPVGTTRSRVSPALERASGLKAERDFHVVFSPERVYSGRVLADLDSYPKLVGGCSPEGERLAVSLYASFLDKVEVRAMGGAEAAELSKLAETTYRDINIAFANELARHADELDIDVQLVIDAANSQPFSHIHRPGIAVGGHCIPVYPRFLESGAPDARLPGLAREINDSMPAYAVRLLGDVTGRRVLILGVAYRGGVKESAFSGAFALRDELVRKGAVAIAADPLYDDGELAGLGFIAWDGSPVDAAIVQADHDEYRDLEVPAPVVVDGRNVVQSFAGEIRRIGSP